ncbi:Phenylalanine--tRNA ligase alpha subunit, cytoplasmic [Camellia lanceoleosa]|uniref:Phenylalanine--tRNA ligase alpha subunit, cytoplasmic n=1 Tax=Camellia lanceoleosa TaxID=1840588 RepID=A0ACC0H4M3_9ERIC|nr:Phenylalanine--tRNA ligase alpha subunit, cytoplasmic [Camellia lanceoleosa]
MNAVSALPNLSRLEDSSIPPSLPLHNHIGPSSISNGGHLSSQISLRSSLFALVTLPWPDKHCITQTIMVWHWLHVHLPRNSHFLLIKDIKRERWVLTEEGRTYAAAGSPEVRVFSAIPREGISPEELQRKMDPTVFKIGRSQAIKNQWLEMGKQLVTKKVQNVQDNVKDMLTRVQNGEVIDPKEIDALKRRKLIASQGDWKDMEFKEYNFSAKGQPIEGGHLHALLKVRQQFKMIFLQMGFEEMPTNNFVESNFWNFDAMFQAQQHPARDSHDTFFLQVPPTMKFLPEDYVERVKRVHEFGGYGSRGYEYDWKREEATKNLLRTHTTAVSSRMLYWLAKYFSIDRVFRNEAVDRTHLAEFHQIEGLVCDRGLTLGDLIGVFNDFFTRLGMSKLKFKPAYNPYTEPSMEIFGYHEGLKKWVEIGNSGMFRPEMLLPMGLPEDVRVIAWGLSLERPTMILYGIDNIRDLFGHKVDLSLIKKNPLCRIGIE